MGRIKSEDKFHTFYILGLCFLYKEHLILTNFSVSTCRNPEDSESRLKAKADSEMQARKCAQKMSKSIFDSAKNVFIKATTLDMYEISKSCLVTTLMPSILAHLPRLAVSNLRVSQTRK
jgi:hypothetical protein